MSSETKKRNADINFANKLLGKRENHSCNASLKNKTIQFIDDLIDILFPHFSKSIYYSADDILARLQLIERNLISLLRTLLEKTDGSYDPIAKQYVATLPVIHDKLWNDAEGIYQGDPAAESIDEVILAYPGFMAILIYRLAHELYLLKIPIVPRIMTEYAHQITGIDIHPAASIGSPFFIDHGTGIVIGETTVIGKNVKIYQGVTLGALSVDKSLESKKRHPTIEDDVIIYSQAVILGGETVIGKNSIIGGNAWVTQSVPPKSVVYSKSEVRIRSTENYFDTIEYII